MKDTEPIDISGMPELSKLVDEARRSKERVLLRSGDDIVAEIVPVGTSTFRPTKVRTPEGRRAFLAAAGSWKDVDVDRLLEDIYESRRLSTKPPVDL